MSSNIKKRIITSIFLISLLALMFFYSYIMIISVIIISIITWVEFYALISKIFRKNMANHKILRFFCKSIALFYLSALVKLYLLYSILVSIMSDIGGLVFGKKFKGKKLTKISPNKTISGSVGSLIFSMMLIPFVYKTVFNVNLLSIFMIIILISIISQLGDLFISLLKRKAKVKDTSDILPGHGGILDRIDGIIFAIPVGIFLFIIF